MDNKPTVFISSTRLDLEPYRAAARDAAERAGFAVTGMETFAPSGEYPLEVCLERVKAADVLVVLVAHRYGSCPPGNTKSYTWLECEHARHVIPFLVKDDAPWDFELRDAAALQKAAVSGDTAALQAAMQAATQLASFKAWLLNRHAGQFSTDHELGKLVLQALTAWREKNPQFGPPPPGDPAAYLEALRNICHYIDIEGLQVSDGVKRQFEIDRIYIPLTTTAEVSEERGMRRDMPLQDALKQPRLMITGDPGAGKTTFLRRLAFALCGPDPSAFAGFSAFPILIRASDLTTYFTTAQHPPAEAESADWIPHFLASKCAQHGLTIEYFRGKLKTGPCLAMIDGLDEAPDDKIRRRVVRIITDAAATYKAAQFVITARPKTTDAPGGFHVAQIGALNRDSVRAFLGEWSKALYPKEPERAEAFRAELLYSVTSRSEIASMAKNPVMLTALAVLQANSRRLPEERVGLYESILTWLAQSREERPGRVRWDTCLQHLQKVALAMQDHTEGLKVQVGRGWAADQIAAEFPDRAAALRFLEVEEGDSGIVVSRAGDVRFWHRSFQEYLCAREIAGWGDARQYAFLVESGKLYRAEWREVMLLFAGVLKNQGKEKLDGLFTAVLNLLGPRPELREQARCAALLGAMMRDLRQEGFEPKDSRFRETVLAVNRIFDPAESRKIEIGVRVEAAEALGQVGDPRLEEDNWVTIPAGRFWMGAQKKGNRNVDPEAGNEEAPVHEVQLAAFQMSRYPVTVQEYARFMEEDGYQNEENWTEGGFGKFDAPEDWAEQRAFPNRPVVGVSWFEAAAYCKWADCRLPTEAEWERAARGPENSRYPWGKGQLDATRANYKRDVGRPTPVGLYPLGRTSEGLYDMLGNVWEWCADWYGEYPSPGPETGAYRVLRGGSWYFDSSNVRVSFRNWYLPMDRNISIGLRSVREVKSLKI
ncbi:MAG: SUMF1/EgtB/PvdO family nonheme iron enzyme [Bryobacteraceae bacterium]|nr:SUMF1/EgtB/PvdO family nonheme iron enzyme [Bryobacteraceae bacterium]